MIRRARFHDAGEIVRLGEAAFNASAYAHRMAFDAGEAKTQLAYYMADREDSLVLVSERGGAVGGFVVASAFALPFSKSRYVSDVALVSQDGSGLWLLRRMVAWARRRGQPVMVNCMTRDAVRGYISSGLTPVGRLFVG